MRIVAVNPGHNGATAYIVDGEVVFYIEEERLSRSKYDGNPFRGMMEAIQMGGIDVLVIGGTHKQPELTWTGEDPFTALARKYNPNVKVVDMTGEHHLGHAAGAFYDSGFDEAVAVIVDGSGTMHNIQLSEEFTNRGFETESIFDCSYDAEEHIKHIFKSYGGNDTAPVYTDELHMDSAVTITKAYEAVSHYLGFGFIEAGKTMGLAPYGGPDENIPDLFIDGRGNNNVFMPNYPAGAFVNEQRIPYLRLKNDPRAWHHDPSLCTDAAKNLAWKIQDETQRLVGDLVEKAIDMTGKKNVVIAGGYGLNCVANYYLQKRFPDVKFFIDPISHDGGTALGLAKLAYFKMTENPKRIPMDTLYLGLPYPEVSAEEAEGVAKSLEELGGTITDVTPADVAKLIHDKNIVTIFQGRSEAGPRALGNRSILFDPTVKDGKDFVNQVKGREWFRPFAGSMLQEHFEEWFETYGLEESPYMMYAMDFKMEKHGEVPAITHVDGTCRIQTVKREQNASYYDLINEFYKLSGVPILFNTSFNLAGEPLVETLFDAVNTIVNSDMNYLYLPEAGKLIKCETNLRTKTEEVDAVFDEDEE